GSSASPRARPTRCGPRPPTWACSRSPRSWRCSAHSRRSRASSPARRRRSSPIASPATSRASPAWRTPGTTSTGCSESRKRRPGWCWPRRSARSSATACACSESAPRIGCDVSLLVVGSIALDSVYTPFGETADAPGGSAVFFAAAGSILHPVQVVGVIGTDYPLGALKALEQRGVDLAGVEQAAGDSFRWKARYSYDLSSRETLDTRLGVLDQVARPALVACDTMNYWIQSKRDLLLELLRHIDILMVNDAEARELSGDWNVYRAAQWVLERGPRMAVIKQGEHGALLVNREATFKVPAYPLQEVFDPTGAGDAFAGGFMAYLASTGDLSAANLRRAMVYGAALGSFAVEAFGIRGLEQVTLADVRARVRAFKELVHFDVDEHRAP